MLRFHPRSIAAVAPFLTVLTAACAPGGAETAPADEARVVHAAEVAHERLAPPITATGVLGPKEEIALSFKVGGVVARILVNEGDVVRSGDTLAALELREIDAAVARARSAAEKADRDLARARRLYADSVATLEQVQNAETGATAARAELETAEFNRRYAVIVAPATGVILRRSVEPGELLSVGTPVVTLGSHARGAVVRAGLADRDVVRVRRGDRAVVRFDALPDREFPGTVTEIAAAADPATGTYRVEIGVAALGLASGLVGQVEIRPAPSREMAIVPIEALLEADGARATVFALDSTGGRALRRQVTIAFLHGDRVAIADGLDGVRRVVTDGAAYLEDGEAVRVRP